MQSINRHDEVYISVEQVADHLHRVTGFSKNAIIKAMAKSRQEEFRGQSFVSCAGVNSSIGRVTLMLEARHYRRAECERAIVDLQPLKKLVTSGADGISYSEYLSKIEAFQV